MPAYLTMIAIMLAVSVGVFVVEVRRQRREGHERRRGFDVLPPRRDL